MGVSARYKQTADHLRKRMAAKAATLASRPKAFAKEWLENLYVEKGMDCVEIGKIAGRDPKSIWSWLKHYGIPTRPRGHNVGQLPRGRSRGFKISQAHKDAVRAARIADGRIPCMKDGKHWLHHEGAVHPNWKGGITPERQALYSSPEWRGAIKEVWARANATCERCGKHHNTASRRGTFHVHHVVSFKVRELRAVATNLLLLCKSCHLFVHSRRNIDKQFLREE